MTPTRVRFIMGCSNSRQLSVDSGTKKEEASVEARISGEYFVSNVRYIPIYVLCSNTLIIYTFTFVFCIFPNIILYVYT